MSNTIFNQVQLREVFHLEFLRWLGRGLKTKHYALKGGVNLRFFFKSFRYSEDMDLDVAGVRVDALQDLVMGIVTSQAFQNNLRAYHIQRIALPDLTKAKQTETTQRFKLHLVTPAGEDLLTKIEFSRRGLKGGVIVQPVSETILRSYKLPPLVAPHYDINSAIKQKIEAVALRTLVQARDIFDLYLLNSQGAELEKINSHNGLGTKLAKAYQNVFEVGFEQFKDTVIPYLAPEEQATYDKASLWEEIKLKAAGLIEELRRRDD